MPPKRHHFIPQAILKNFADKSGMIWFHRETFGTEIRRTNIKNIFVQSELNTIFDNGKKDVRIEEIFAKLDSGAADVFTNIINNTRDGKAFELSNNAWQFCFDYLYYQIKRPPSAMLAAEKAASLTEVLREAIAEQDSIGKGPDAEERARLLSGAGMGELRHNALAFARIRRPEPFLEQFLAKCGLNVLVIRGGRSSFALGDVAVLSPTKNLPRFVMPIAPDVALVISYAQRHLQIVNVRDRAEVRRINLELAHASTVIAGKDPSLLEFLLERRLGSGVGLPLIEIVEPDIDTV